MKKFSVLFLFAFCCFQSVSSYAEEQTPVVLKGTTTAAGPVSESLAREGQAAAQRSMKWLLARQNPDGYWSNKDFPALTALPLWALIKAGCTDTGAIDRAVNYILSCVREDGSIWSEPSVQQKGGGLANYNTAICMVALHATGKPELVPVIQKARRFIASTQHFGDDVYKGGMGYDPSTGRPYADLSNSYIAYEAMRLTQNVEDLRKSGDPKADLDWKAAQQFIQRVQNLPGSNDQPWADGSPEQKGGFAYKPDSSQAGSFTNSDGTVRLRSYGSMTYAGLLSFIYAEVDRNDPRVASAFNWALNHWTLDENPGMGQQGLYYFYNVLSKALSLYEQDVLSLRNEQKINWREELTKKLISLQKIDPDGTGYWVNSEGRWWEADPTLVTSYSLIALEMALQH
jgi:squalene-hopene/tetraprenyl-beta-curcumene cyclase